MSRQDKDYYPTPRWAIDLLLDNYQLQEGWILEPCAGNGVICAALRDHAGWDGSISAVEIRAEEQTALEEHCDEVYINDFLKLPKGCFGAAPGTIITNPPFSCAKEIIEHSFEIADERTETIMLLRLGWLETKDRYDFWRKHSNVSLITLRDRPKFVGNGTDFAAYGWFIWSNREQFVLPCVAGEESR
ncbi:MAG TPA: hypothetical protein VN512_13090 [Clostridia bacterium]|nr:hypothetical protein [Clostridia bacterium]